MRLSDIVSHSGLAVYAEVALVLFLIAFLMVAARLLARGERREWEHMRRLPLEENEPGPPPGGATP